MKLGLLFIATMQERASTGGDLRASIAWSDVRRRRGRRRSGAGGVHVVGGAHLRWPAFLWVRWHRVDEFLQFTERDRSLYVLNVLSSGL